MIPRQGRGLLLRTTLWGARMKENKLMYPSIGGASLCGTTCLIQASLCHCACVDKAHLAPSSSRLWEKTLTLESSEERSKSENNALSLGS